MTTEKSLVSIVVRTKDRPKLLSRSLASVAAQTYRSLEVVLVNDGGCELNVEELQQTLGKVQLKYVRIETNQGRAHAANVGIDTAAGRYVGFLDDDDELYPEHAEVLCNLLERIDFRAAYADAEIVYKEYNPVTKEIQERPDNSLLLMRDFSSADLLVDNYIPLICLLFERDLLLAVGGFDEDFNLYEDWDLLIRCSIVAPFHHVRRTTCKYMQWSPELQIAQSGEHARAADRGYEQIYLKHQSLFTPPVIHQLREYRKGYETISRELKQREQRDEHIENFERQLNDHKATIATLEQQLSDVRKVLNHTDLEKNQLIAERDLANNHLLQSQEAILQELSSVHQAILAEKDSRLRYVLKRLRHRLLPIGTRRRLIAKTLYLAIKDPRPALHNLNWRNLKRFSTLLGSADLSLVEQKVEWKMSHAQPNAVDDQKTPQMSTGEEVFAEDVANMLPDVRGNRVLVLDRWLPEYDRDSGAQRMYFLLRIMTELGLRVTFLPDDLRRLEPYATELERLGIAIVHGSVNIEDYLRKEGAGFSTVLVSRPEQAYKYLPLIRAYAIHSSVLYDTVDLHWVRFQRGAEVTGDDALQRKAEEYKAIELFNSICADTVLTVTNNDKSLLRKENPELRIEVLPNVHEVAQDIQPYSGRKNLMFIGSFLHKPNEDAMIYFVNGVLPLICRRIPHIKLFIVGGDPSESVRALASENVIVTGYVKDVGRYFQQSRVFVSPLRYGAGMKGKIGQSMGYGLPVVTTQIGAEGIGLTDGETALIGDDEQSFADAVVRLYADEVLWNRLSKQSTAHIDKHFSPAAVSSMLAGILDPEINLERDTDIVKAR